MSYVERRAAEKAFYITDQLGERTLPTKGNKGSLRFKNKDFNITCLFAGGSDFEGRDLSDCSVLKISYKRRRVLTYYPWDGIAIHYKFGSIWEKKLDDIYDKLNRRIPPEELHDIGCLW